MDECHGHMMLEHPGIHLGTVIKHLSHGKCKVFIPGVYPSELSSSPDKLPDARSSVYANRWLGRALWGRSPDAAWQQTSQFHDTIVFPNGYDIRAGSQPSRLYLHEFRTVTDPEQLYSKRDERYLDLSRIMGSAV